MHAKNRVHSVQVLPFSSLGAKGKQRAKASETKSMRLQNNLTPPSSLANSSGQRDERLCVAHGKEGNISVDEGNPTFIDEQF